MLLLRAVHRPPGSMVRSDCYGSISGVKSPSRRARVREATEADVCEETHNSLSDVCGVRSPAALLHKVRFDGSASGVATILQFKRGRRETLNVLR